MNIKFVKAQKEDCYLLSRVKKEVWNTTYRGIYSDDELDNYDYLKHENKFIEGLNGLYLIKDAKEIIGYFNFSYPKYPYKNYEYCLNSLYILSEYQSKGIGTKVFNFINDYCKKNKIAMYFVSVNKYNVKAYKFYLKMGGTEADLEEEGEDKSTHQYRIVFNLKI